MFNEEQKKEFIRYYANGDKNTLEKITVFFKKVYRKAEKDFDKDIADMHYDELKLAICLLGSKSVSSIGWNISIINSYIDWCIKNGRTNTVENNAKLISATSIDNSYVYKVETLSSPEHLEKILNVVYPRITNLYLTNMYRIYIWLLYHGLNNTEATHLKKDEIDLDTRLIKTKDKTIEMNQYLFDVLLVTMQNSSLITRRNETDIFIPLCDNEYVLRLYKDTRLHREKQFGARITVFNNRYKDATDTLLRLTPLRIYQSGIFYRWQQLELDGCDIPFNDYVDIITEGKEYAIKVDYVKAERLKMIKHDYSMWKKAFDL